MTKGEANQSWLNTRPSGHTQVKLNPTLGAGVISDEEQYIKIKSLRDRRDELCLKFAKKCLKIEKFQKYFPLNKKKHCMSMRSTEMFELGRSGSTRYQKSAIPYMISILNKYESKRSDSLRKISVPMNYDAPVSISLR